VSIEQGTSGLSNDVDHDGYGDIGYGDELSMCLLFCLFVIVKHLLRSWSY
jgi:hypothetical protein